ncbi:MAG: alkaline phosphatase family protein [Proteobacteria bacterium]|nr:alkaline phosphatase family protein [Pseudomonadota bacterium]
MGLFDKFKKKDKHSDKVLVIGLDGVPYCLIQDLTGKGRMPNLARLLQQGSAGNMESSMPPVSSVAWTTFMTGVNPAKHGIFGFMEKKDDSYDLYFPNATHIKSPAIWDMLGRAGKTTIAVNIPQTYPAREISGIIISGFISIDLEKAVTPSRLLPVLREMDYRIDVNYQEAAEKKDEFFGDLFYTLKKRREAFLYLMEKEPWNLFIGVFTGTDRLQHYFWGDYADKHSAYHQQFLDYYTAIDQVIGEMLDRAGDETPLIILADHGFSLLKKEVFLNAWLKQKGFLKLKKDPPQSFGDIHPESTAFVLDPSRVYINMNSVPRTKYHDVCKQLTEGFLGLKDEETAAPLIRRVYTKEEIFSGPFMDKAPDLVLWSAPGYDLKGAISKNEILGTGKFTGMHTFDDAFLYIRQAQSLPAKPRICDVAPTILKYCGISIPEYMDGTPLV